MTTQAASGSALAQAPYDNLQFARLGIEDGPVSRVRVHQVIGIRT